MPLTRLASAALLALAACTQVPELGAVVPPDLRAAEYPQLIPLGPELSVPQDPGAEAERVSDNLNARVARLKRRAQALNQASVVDGATRTRMEEGVHP